MSSEKLCFVVGPIGEPGSIPRKHADLLLNLVIIPANAALPAPYHVRRGDADARPMMITDRVVSDVKTAAVVVADLTFLNPNVFYELGIRHAEKKPTVHMMAAGTKLPFDNIAHDAITFDLGDYSSIEGARKALQAALTAIEGPDYRVSNPVVHADDVFKMRQSADPKDRLWAELDERLRTMEARMSEATARPLNHNDVLSELEQLWAEAMAVNDADLDLAISTVTQRWHANHPMIGLGAHRFADGRGTYFNVDEPRFERRFQLPYKGE